MKKYFRLLRIKHYLKNFIIFLPLIFSKNITIDNIKILLLSFVIFSMAASFVYIINDIRDVESDRNHAVKKNRPIASSEISIRKAILIAIFLLLFSSISALYFLGYVALLLVLIYILINILYSLGLKDIALVDIVILVLGFVIRMYYGAVVIDIEISHWLYLTVMSFAFYLGLGKRRNELMKSSDTRKVLKFYTKDFLDKNMYMCLTIGIVFYSLWASNQGKAVLTVPLFILIFMRYNLNIEKDSHGDPIDVIFSDKILIMGMGLFMMILMGILYFL